MVTRHFSQALAALLIFGLTACSPDHGKVGAIINSPGHSASAGSDPFSVMASRAAAWGTATGHTFNAYFQEDFLLGAATVSTVAGGSGAATFSTNATPYGDGGFVKLASTTTSADYAIATSINGSALANDWTTSSYYSVSLCTIHGAMSTNVSTHGSGFGRAATANGSNPFVLLGEFNTGCTGGSATNWGFTLYNGTTQTCHAGSTAFDVDVQHYMAVGHDATTHAFYGYIDWALVDSVSDAPMVGHGAVAPYMIFDQAVTGGYMLCDKVYAAI